MSARDRPLALSCLLAVWVSVACATRADQAVTCDVATGAAASDSTGTYDLVLWTADGARALGQLTLWRRAADDQTVAGSSGPAEGIRQTHWGFSDADVAEVGAVVPGGVGATDPDAPGVGVYWTPERTLLRFGSEANRQDRVRFDGAHLTLTVERWTDSGLEGGWISFGGDEPEAEGRFCATFARPDDRDA